jgi:hypothetical protein
MAIAGVGCVTAPPGDLPAAPVRGPMILRGTAQPSLEDPLLTWPSDDAFIVWVDLGDPGDGAAWNAFVDNIEVGNGIVTGHGGQVRIQFDWSLPAPPTCHRIDFVVAHRFAGTEAGPLPRTPDSVGVDFCTWFYFPGGGPDGCPAYDAGSDVYVGPIVDAADDADGAGP